MNKCSCSGASLIVASVEIALLHVVPQRTMTMIVPHNPIIVPHTAPYNCPAQSDMELRVGG